MSNKYYCVSERDTGAVNALRAIVTAFIWVILRGVGLLTDLYLVAACRNIQACSGFCDDLRCATVTTLACYFLKSNL